MESYKSTSSNIGELAAMLNAVTQQSKRGGEHATNSPSSHKSVHLTESRPKTTDSPQQ